MKYQFKAPDQFTVNPVTFEMEMNVFSAHDGYVEHFINGRIRALVPFENWGAYALAVKAARDACLVQVVDEQAIEIVQAPPESIGLQDRQLNVYADATDAVQLGAISSDSTEINNSGFQYRNTDAINPAQ